MLNFIKSMLFQTDQTHSKENAIKNTRKELSVDAGTFGHGKVHDEAVARKRRDDAKVWFAKTYPGLMNTKDTAWYSRLDGVTLKLSRCHGFVPDADDAARYLKIKKLLAAYPSASDEVGNEIEGKLFVQQVFVVFFGNEQEAEAFRKQVEAL